MRRGLGWYAILLPLALADIAATQYQIILFGTEIERNPLQRWIIENLGFGASYAFRLITPAIGIYLLCLIKEKNPQYKGIVNFWLVLAVIISVGVVLYHIYLTDFFTIHNYE